MQWRVYGRLPYAPGLKPPAPPEPEVHLVDSTYIASGAATSTTQRLTGLTGTFTAGRISDDTNPLASIDIGNDGNTEVEFCVKIAASVTDGTQFKFRITDNGAPLDTYTITPVVTVSTSGALAPPVGLRAAPLVPDPDIEYSAREWRQAEIEFAPQWRAAAPDIRTTDIAAKLFAAAAKTGSKIGQTDVFPQLGPKGADSASKIVATSASASLALRASDAAGRFASYDVAARLFARADAGTAKRGQGDQAARLLAVAALGTAKIGVTGLQGAFAARSSAAASKTGTSDVAARAVPRAATTYAVPGAGTTDLSARLLMRASTSAVKLGSADVAALLVTPASEASAKTAASAVAAHLAAGAFQASAKIAPASVAARLAAPVDLLAVKIGVTVIGARAAPRGETTFAALGGGGVDLRGLLVLRASTSAGKLAAANVQAVLSARASSSYVLGGEFAQFGTLGAPRPTSSGAARARIVEAIRRRNAGDSTRPRNK